MNPQDLKLMESMKRMDKIHGRENNKQIEDVESDDGEGAGDEDDDEHVQNMKVYWIIILK